MEGDQILEVNGQNLRDATQEVAAVLLKVCIHLKKKLELNLK